MKPFKDTVTHDKAAARTRRAMWLGLFGVAARLLETRNAGERKRCEERMAMYVTRLREAGVEPTPESDEVS